MVEEEMKKKEEDVWRFCQQTSALSNTISIMCKKRLVFATDTICHAESANARAKKKTLHEVCVNINTTHTQSPDYKPHYDMDYIIICRIDIYSV